MDPSYPPLAVPLKEARALAGRALNRLERSASALRLAAAGEVRRMEPWVRRVELIATAHEAGPLLDSLVEAPFAAGTLERTARGVLVKTTDGLHLRLEVIEDETCFGAALLRSTGPATYVHSLHTLARSRRMRWEGDRLFEASDVRGGAEEGDVLAALGLPWQPPERRGRGSLEEGTPPGLLEMRDVVGVAGLHAGWGPGRYRAGELTSRAQREGYAWALVTDEDTDEELQDPDVDDEAEGMTELPGYVVRVGKSGPAQPLHPDDIAPGGLCLAYLPSDARPDGPAATDLFIRAARQPIVDVVCLCMPGGAAGERQPLDVARLLDALAAAGVALGLPPPPHHPEPEPELLEAAANRGIPLLLLAEARDLVSVDDQILAVGLARRAAVARSLVLNTFSVRDLGAWAALRRDRVAGP